jgi:peptidoglycan hydrolase-like protein with peptidoglycan-binding domain
MILPGVNSTNSLVVTRTGSAKELGGKIGKVGLSFNMSMSRAEGMGSGVRALVELGMIELVGKLLEVPYWKCLGIEKTNPLMMQQARDFYDSMGPEEQTKFIQRKLKASYQYNGEISGRFSPELSSAIAKFQAENDLIADGRINFDLYYALLDSDTGIAPDPTEKKKALIAAPQSTPINLTITSDTNGRYQINDTLLAHVQTSSDGFLYCYYQDVSGSIARIFPNRFNPNPFIKGNNLMSLPSEKSPFKIKFDKTGNEQLACYASNHDLAVPSNIKGEDLTPLQVGSMGDIGNAFRKTDPKLSEAKLDIIIH